MEDFCVLFLTPGRKRLHQIPCCRCVYFPSIHFNICIFNQPFYRGPVTDKASKSSHLITTRVYLLGGEGGWGGQERKPDVSMRKQNGLFGKILQHVALKQLKGNVGSRWHVPCGCVSRVREALLQHTEYNLSPAQGCNSDTLSLWICHWRLRGLILEGLLPAFCMSFICKLFCCSRLFCHHCYY